jgi:vacuolar iron transporter family protein
LTAGLSALGSSRLVIIGGLAELFSGAISMGVGGYFSTRAERDNYHYLERQTKKRLEEAPALSFECEVFDIFSKYGVDHRTSVQVAKCLWNSDADKDKAKANMNSFLLKFGECVESVPTSRVYASALTIALSYFLGGLIPMVPRPKSSHSLISEIPYFVIEVANHAMIVSIGITALVLLAFGTIKGRTTGSRRERIWLFVSAIETLAVGALAAGASYGIVRLVNNEGASQF